MHRICFIAAFSIFSLLAAAQSYQPVDEGSKVHFIIKNFGINTGGDLSGLKGTIVFNPANPAASDFNISINIKTINTDSENRDEHLRSESYFDVEKYPVILIRSTKIIAANSDKGSSFNFTGMLTMRGITKEISFPFTATPKGNDYLFAGEFELDRLDYSVGSTSAVLSNKVKVALAVLAKKS